MFYRTQLFFKSKDIYAAYPPNTQVFVPQKHLADSGRSAKFFDFSIFFLEISAVQLFFGENIFLDKILDTQNVSKNHEKFFGEQHNIKEWSHENFLSVHTKGTKKFNFFDFSYFLAEIMGTIAY